MNNGKSDNKNAGNSNSTNNTRTDSARKVPDAAFSPLYAIAGLTDLITTEVGQRLARLQPVELQSLARSNADELLSRFSTQYSTLVGRGRSRVDDVRKQAGGLKDGAQGRLRDAYGSFLSAAKSGGRTR